MLSCTANFCCLQKVEEVPIEGDAAGGYSVGSLDKPTARLSQYARGKTGSMNPFTPGGEVGTCGLTPPACADLCIRAGFLLVIFLGVIVSLFYCYVFADVLVFVPAYFQ